VRTQSSIEAWANDKSAYLIDLTDSTDPISDYSLVSKAPVSLSADSKLDQVEISSDVSSSNRTSNGTTLFGCVSNSSCVLSIEASEPGGCCANKYKANVLQNSDGKDDSKDVRGDLDSHGVGVDGIDVDEDVRCLVCDEDLGGLGTAADRDAHVRRCCRRAGLLSPSPSHQVPSGAPAATTRQVGIQNGEELAESTLALDFGGGPLDSAELYCVVCGRDISGWGIYYRCMHIKRCARSQGLSVRAVLRLISPLDDLADVAPRGEEQRSLDTIDLAGMGSDAVSGKARTDINSVLMNATRTAAMLKASTVGKPSGSSISNATSITSASVSVPTAPSASINYVLMTAARQRALARLGDAAPVDAAVSVLGRGAANDKGSASSKLGGKRKTAAPGTGSSGPDPLPGGGGQGRAGGRGRGRFGQQKREAVESGVSYAPEYKKVYCVSSSTGGSGGSSMLPIIVDGFVFASRGLSDTYVLTHFHSDHYDGLRKSFDCGRILCSPTTAALVRLRLGVPGARLVPLTLETRHSLTLSGGQQVDVTLVDANHCPGAVCVLFEFRSGKVWAYLLLYSVNIVLIFMLKCMCPQRVFHTGDFRFDAAAMLPRSPTLRRLVSYI
jgi:hypothetical protein